MFCHKCGNQAPEGSEFCKKCGLKLIGDEGSTVMTIAPDCIENNMQSVNSQAPAKKKVRWYISLPMIFVMTFIFFPVSIGLYIWRFIVTRGTKKHKSTIAYMVCTVLVVVGFAVWSISLYQMEENRFKEINTAIESEQYEIAYELLKQAEKSGSESKIRDAYVKYYKAQGLYDEAADVLIKYYKKNSSEDSQNIVIVTRLKEIEASLSEEKQSEVSALIADFEYQKQLRAEAKARETAEKEKNAQPPAEKTEPVSSKKQSDKEFTYKGQPINFVDIVKEDDVIKIFGVQDYKSSGYNNQFDDVSIGVDDELILIRFDAPSQCEIGGVTLDKSREELIKMLGKPAEESSSGGIGQYIIYYYPTYSIDFEIEPNGKANTITVSILGSKYKSWAEKKEAERKENSIIDYMNACQEYSFNVLDKDSERLKGQKIWLTGKVVQAMDQEKSTFLRVDMSYDDIFSDDIVAVIFEGYQEIYKDDIINVYGEIAGFYTYTSQADIKITVPQINGKHWEWQP